MFFLGRLNPGDELNGSNLLPRLDVDEFSAMRPSVRRGGKLEEDNGPVRIVEGVDGVSRSSASPR